jgi:hypothetical protein
MDYTNHPTSSSSSSSSFHTPECSCSPSCSFHPPFSSLNDDEGCAPSPSSSSAGDSSIEDVLPVEVLQHVLGFVPLGHLAGDVARTSRLWRSLALDPALWLPHWRRLHFARPNIELPENDVRRGVQPPPEGAWRDERGSESDPWLLDAGRSLQQAFDDDYPIDWRREYLRRKNLRVLIVTYHTSHSNHYDMDTVRQFKKFGIHADICHLMCNHDAKAETAGGFYNYVEFDDNLFMKYDTIIYFAAMSGGEAMKKILGDGLMAFLKSGGGVIFCIYTHMKSYQLAGKWTESFYPIKPANRVHPFPSDSQHHKKREKGQHAIMSGVRNTQIDPTRHGSRCTGNIDPLATVVGEYDDGVPLVVVLDGEANRVKAREADEEAERTAREKDGEGGDEDGDGSGHGVESGRSSDDGTSEGEKKLRSDLDHEGEWGKTVFLNFFPVSKDDPCTGGWYDWNSDIPLLLRNAVLFAARRGPPPSPAATSSFPH